MCCGLVGVLTIRVPVGLCNSNFRVKPKIDDGYVELWLGKGFDTIFIPRGEEHYLQGSGRLGERDFGA